jgi:hypothetical protein
MNNMGQQPSMPYLSRPMQAHLQAQAIEQTSSQGSAPLMSAPTDQSKDRAPFQFGSAPAHIPAAPQSGRAGPAQDNTALQNYQMQLMLLETQNKKRLLMARQELDATQGVPGAMQWSERPGPAMQPNVQMKRSAPAVKKDKEADDDDNDDHNDGEETDWLFASSMAPKDGVDVVDFLLDRWTLA